MNYHQQNCNISALYKIEHCHLCECLITGDLELTLLALPIVFYTIRWNYYLYLPFAIVPTNKIALNKFYGIERKAKSQIVISVSNALDRSINIVSTFLLLSRAGFHFSIIFSKAFACCGFCENLDSKNRCIWLKTILSNNLDEWKRTLTGW